MIEQDYMDYVHYWNRMCKAHQDFIKRKDPSLTIRIRPVQRQRQRQKPRQMNLGDFTPK